jgi:hypothetical protein
MLSMKYKVRRNDTSATADLASIYPPERVASATRFVSFPRVDGFRLYRRETYSITEEEIQMSIWTILFVVLLIAWLGGFTVFHVAGGLIHLLLIFAVISLILHFVLGPRAV